VKAAKKDWCSNEKEKGEIAREFCKKSCDLCGPAAPPSPPSSCMDDDDGYKEASGRSKKCAKDSKKCDKDNNTGEAAREYCKLTCGTC